MYRYAARLRLRLARRPSSSFLSFDDEKATKSRVGRTCEMLTGIANREQNPLCECYPLLDIKGILREDSQRTPTSAPLGHSSP